MNVFDMAINMEEKSETHYREMAKVSSQRALQDIMFIMADEEASHVQKLKKIRDKVPITPDPQLMRKAKAFFKKMQGMQPDFKATDDELEIYKKIRDMEKDSEKVYRSYAKEVDDENTRNALLILAEEEHKHFFVIDNLVNMVSRPTEWLENAEWNHLDEY